MKKSFIKKAQISSIEDVLGILNINDSHEIIHAKKWHNLLIVEIFKNSGKISKRYFFNGVKEFIAQIFKDEEDGRFKWSSSTDLIYDLSAEKKLWTKKGHQTAKEYFLAFDCSYCSTIEMKIRTNRQFEKAKKHKADSKDAYMFKNHAEMTASTKRQFEKAVINAHADMSEESNRIFAQRVGNGKYELECSICGHKHTVSGQWKNLEKSMTCPKCGHKSILSNRNNNRRPVKAESLFYWSEYKKGMVCLTGYQVVTIVDFDMKESYLFEVIPKERIIIKKDWDGKIHETAYRWSNTYNWIKTDFLSSWKKATGIGYKALNISWHEKNLIQTLKKAKGFYGTKFVDEIADQIKAMKGEDISPLMFFDRFALELSNIGLVRLRRTISYPEKTSSNHHFKYEPYSYKSTWNDDDFSKYFDAMMSDKTLRGILSNGLNPCCLEILETYVYLKEHKDIQLKQVELKAINELYKEVIKEAKSNNRTYWSLHTLSSLIDLINVKQRPIKVKNYLTKQKRLLYMSLYDVISLMKDYRRMSEQLGISLAQSVLAFPKNLQVAHDQRVKQMNKANAIKKAQEVREMARRMIANYPESMKKEYVDEEAGLLIRPFLTLSEIKREGIMQHHCIYSYHNNPENLFVVRQLSDPTKPYVAVESQNGKIIQARGHHNSTPPEPVNNFLNGLMDKGYFSNTAIQ